VEETGLAVAREVNTMPVTYTNRKGQTFFLCRGTTKTGKPRYMFALQTTGEIVEKIPDGYQIKESVNGVVSLVIERPQIITAQERNLITEHLKRHPKGENYRADIKGNQIILYERLGPDFDEMKDIFGSFSPLPSVLLDQRIHEHLDKHSRYSYILRFILIDQELRIFYADRWYDNGPEKRWVSLYQSGPLDQLAKLIIPRLGTNRFYELF
jgi:hypothetical protein